MLILLDCRPLQYGGRGSEKARFILSAAAAIAGDKSVQWLYLADHTWSPGDLPLPPGVTPLIHRAMPGRAGWKLWYDWQIPRLTKKHKADLVMLTGGITAPSLKAPLCLWMPVSANPKEGKEGKSYLPLYSRRLAESLREADTVFCFSERDRYWLAGRQAGGKDNSRPDKYVVLRGAPDEGAMRLMAEEREMVKQQYAGGKEYFFADVTAAGNEEVVLLLRSFSLFKKRQLSNMQLILTGRGLGPEGGLKERLETYKYRQDIHWCNPDGQEELKVMGAAYALLLPFEPDDRLGLPLLNAWKAGVPVILRKDGRLQELAGEAALAAGGGDPASLAGQLMTIYKDEALRRSLLEKGLLALEPFNWQRSVAAIWEGIGLATGQKAAK